MAEELALVKNPDLLGEDHIPSEIPARQEHIKIIVYCLRPAFNKKKPLHVWLFGKPGTGKTLVAKYVLRKMEKEACVGGVYVNCWEHNSYYSVLDALVRELRMLGAEKLNTSFKLERLRLFLGSRPFLIVLDEIDMPKRKERDFIVYNLCNLGNVGLILVSNTSDAFFSMDERIRSRLNARQIEFDAYASAELAGILKRRAEIALSPVSWKRTTLEIIAGLAEGDARAAFQTLRTAAYMAESDRSAKIGRKHIRAGYNAAKVIKKTYLLNRLTTHHRLLYELVREQKEINSGELWKAYLSRCRAENKPAIALRTFSEYMNKLIELDLVRWDRALVRGKVRVFKLAN